MTKFQWGGTVISFLSIFGWQDLFELNVNGSFLHIEMIRVAFFCTGTGREVPGLKIIYLKGIIISLLLNAIIISSFTL